MSRMKQRNKFSAIRIERRDVWPFMQIAEATGDGQIIRLCLTTMLPGDDMFDVKKRELGRGLRQSAVFANAAGSNLNQGPQRTIHQDCLRS